MADIKPYGVTQNANAEMITANALVGDNAGSMRAEQANPDYGPAVHSTAPYKGGPKVKTAPPLVRRVASTGQPLCIGKNDTCTAWRMKDSDYCRWHG